MDVEIKDIGSFRDYSLDDSLYSRQRYVLGDFAMSRLSKSDIFLSGLGGIGVEISKNLILAGIKSITLHDDRLATLEDLSTQFYITENDIGKNRAVISHPKLSELNPYVKVHQSTLPIPNLMNDLSYLLQFKCVIITDGFQGRNNQIQINEYCRNHGIYFIMVDSLGLFGWVFNDFGEDFKVYDKNGEETKEVFIASISQAEEAIVTCMENNMHGLEDGDSVQFREVFGMVELNDLKQPVQIKVINPNSFSISLDTRSFQSYQRGGIVQQVKIPFTLQFKSLKESIKSPEFLEYDLLKSPQVLHNLREALEIFRDEHNSSLPRSFNSEDAKQYAEIFNRGSENQFNDPILLERVSFTCQSKICPLTSILGGFAAQEVLKSITGKFTPLKQWLYIDAFELLPREVNLNIENYTDVSGLKSARSKSQVLCLGRDVCERLESSRLFMIGSGAIGCEMLKNYALLGVACGDNGVISVTDNDLIEKSNLNRQFLFRNSDINQSKSKSASRAVKSMNGHIHIDALELKVDVNSESTFNSDFYSKLDLVVSALDNVEARLYVDSKCVQNSKPLLESGTLGTKGHTQVILPHQTESYASQKDPDEKQTPFCTLKSFPTNIDHCIQWSRDKFEKLFSINPLELDKFLQESDYLQKLLTSNVGNKIAIAKSLSKQMESYPKDFKDCVGISRVKFEKFFNFAIKELLKAYPLDLKTKEGLPFWSSPKRPPTPLVFDRNDSAHLDFIQEYSNLLANIFKISSQQRLNRNEIFEFVEFVKVPEFKSKNKAIISDEKAQKPVESFSFEQFQELLKKLEVQLKEFKESDFYSSTTSQQQQQLQVQQFEKDDDSNHHIDFITSISNLRAKIYFIGQVDRFKVKLIAGKIIPAIATTTSVVSGLVSLELIKILSKKFTKENNGGKLEPFKNVYLNLAIPYFSQSEPGEAPKHKVTSNFSYTLWDKWEIDRPSMTFQEFNRFFSEKYNLIVSGIYHDVSMLYLAALPFHKKRLNLPIRDHIDESFINNNTCKYVDLFVSFLEENGEDAKSPPIRFYL